LFHPIVSCLIGKGSRARIPRIVPPGRNPQNGERCGPIQSNTSKMRTIPGRTQGATAGSLGKLQWLDQGAGGSAGEAIRAGCVKYTAAVGVRFNWPTRYSPGTLRTFTWTPVAVATTSLYVPDGRFTVANPFAVKSVEADNETRDEPSPTTRCNLTEPSPKVAQASTPYTHPGSA
jgi:hypothetical protein